MKLVASVLLVLISTMSAAFAAPGLVIHSAEFGVGKFHRYDNGVHPYAADSAWKPYILPAGAPTDKPLTVDNADGSVTVYFSTLDELIATAISISDARHQPIAVLNVHGHGLPGAMWFPKDANDLASYACADWRDAAAGSDEGNYSQYYSAVSAEEVQQIRAMAENNWFKMGCTTGVDEWKAAVAKAPRFKEALAADAQLHFLSCVVGLGTAGKNFTEGMAALLLKGGQARVETSTNFGLGDWSMPEGMGFWDYLNDTQINHDNDLYVVDHKDREIMQKGTIRMVSYSGAAWASTLLGDRDFMSLAFETSIQGTLVAEPAPFHGLVFPTRVRVPGTTAYVRVRE